MTRYVKARDVNEQGHSSTAWVPESELSTGGGAAATLALETPTGDVDGVNDTFTFTGPPLSVFRNGVMERRLGSVVGNTFVFDSPPDADDDIEGLV